MDLAPACENLKRPETSNPKPYILQHLRTNTRQQASTVNNCKSWCTQVTRNHAPAGWSVRLPVSCPAAPVGRVPALSAAQPLDMGTGGGEVTTLLSTSSQRSRLSSLLLLLSSPSLPLPLLAAAVEDKGFAAALREPLSCDAPAGATARARGPRLPQGACDRIVRVRANRITFVPYETVKHKNILFSRVNRRHVSCLPLLPNVRSHTFPYPLS